MVGRLREGECCALVVDAENVPGWIRDGGLACLCRELERRVFLKYRRGYAMWSRGHMRKSGRLLAEQGFDAVACENPHKTKEAADFEMSLDALELVAGDPGIQTVIVVSGDAHYYHLLQRLHRRGLRVVLVAPESAYTRDVANICRGWLDTEHHHATQQPSLPGLAGSERVLHGPAFDHACKRLRKRLRRRGGQLEIARLNQGGMVDYRGLGYRTFKQFLVATGMVTLEQPDGRWTARLRRPGRRRRNKKSRRAQPPMQPQSLVAAEAVAPVVLAAAERTKPTPARRKPTPASTGLGKARGRALRDRVERAVERAEQLRRQLEKLTGTQHFAGQVDTVVPPELAAQILGPPPRLRGPERSPEPSLTSARDDAHLGLN